MVVRASVARRLAHYRRKFLTLICHRRGYYRASRARQGDITDNIGVNKWVPRDSNPGPTSYEPAALTAELGTQAAGRIAAPSCTKAYPRLPVSSNPARPNRVLTR